MHRTRPLLPLLTLLVALALRVSGAETITEQRMEALFQPLLADSRDMSTDGRYFAYTARVGSELKIIVVDLDRMKVQTRITADEDRDVFQSKAKRPSRLRFLGWANDHRLVFAPEFISTSTGGIAPIMAVNADGTNPQQLSGNSTFVDVKDAKKPTLRESARISGFDAGPDHDQLLVETVEFGTLTRFRLDAETGAVKPLRTEGVPDKVSLVLDRSSQVRMNVADEGFGRSSFEYRPPDTSVWRKMPAPPEVTDPPGFAYSPATYFKERAIPLGFDYDPNVLLYASNVGRDTFGVYGLDLTTGRRTSLALELPDRDFAIPATPVPARFSIPVVPRGLIFDRFRATLVGAISEGSRRQTVWLDPQLAEVQRTLDARFPQFNVQLSQWNKARTRFIVDLVGGKDPGRTMLFSRPERRLSEIVSRARWLKSADLHETEYFEFTTASGVPLTGHLTLPRRPKVDSPPLVVWFARGLPSLPHPDYDAQAQVLADMGFVVCRLNQRGTLGYGAKFRDGLRDDMDRAATDDALAAVDWIARSNPIDRKRVITLGEGFAAHLALRATQLQPETFRCAIVFDPLIDLVSLVEPPVSTKTDPEGFIASTPPSAANLVTEQFLQRGRDQLIPLQVTSHADEFSAPVFIGNFSPVTEARGAQTADLRRHLARRDLPCAVVEYEADFTYSGSARARFYRAMEEFINLNLYAYGVKVGPTRVVK